MQGATVIIESGTNTHVGRIALLLCLLYACAMKKSKSVKAVLRVLFAPLVYMQRFSVFLS